MAQSTTRKCHHTFTCIYTSRRWKAQSCYVCYWVNSIHKSSFYRMTYVNNDLLNFKPPTCKSTNSWWRNLSIFPCFTSKAVKSFSQTSSAQGPKLWSGKIRFRWQLFQNWRKALTGFLLLCGLILWCSAQGHNQVQTDKVLHSNSPRS